MAKITINNGARTVQAESGSRLIDVLIQQGIHLPSACGSQGRCGLCRIQVAAGAEGITDEEKAKLTKEELETGIRLACRRTLDADTGITLPIEFLNMQEYTAALLSKHFLTYDILELTFKLLSPATITFIPGQYMLMRAPAGKDGQPITRPFSIASSPSLEDRIRFNVRLNPQGTCTPYLFNVIKEGDILQFKGPRGAFFLQNTERPIIFVAGGSGLAPVHSILSSMREHRIDRTTWLFFGALAQKDLFYVDELKKLEQELPDFHFVPALSNEPEKSDWSGERGQVTEVMDRKLASDVSNAEVYLSGRPGMINSCLSILKSKGIPDERIFYDIFTIAK
jgi:Na+-transporting NADH:ubiquinone oxidoreductase subunit F